MTYDVVIIGAGPAGATLGQLLAGKYRVLLVDRRRLDAPPGKCCGGLLAPDAQKALAGLGLDIPRDVLVARQLFAVRALDAPTGRERLYGRHYLNLDRRRFERYLLSRVTPEVDVRTGWTFRAATRQGEGFRITLSRAGRSVTVQARVLVGADGANSAVRRQLPGRQPWPKTYLAIQEWFEAPGPMPYFTAVFDPRITDYYAWVIPKDDHLLVGAALWPVRRAPGRFQRLRATLEGFGLRLGPPLAREAGLLLRPTSVEQIRPVADGVALIGEAAGWISPSSGEGISYALRSAVALADALGDGLDGFAERYRRASKPLRNSIRRKLLKCPLIYRPGLRAAVMRTGVGALRPGPARTARLQPAGP